MSRDDSAEGCLSALIGGIIFLFLAFVFFAYLPYSLIIVFIAMFIAYLLIYLS